MLLNVDNSIVLASFWGPPSHKLPKIGRFSNLPHKEFISAGTTSSLQFLVFLVFIFVGFGRLQGAILNAPQEEMLFTMDMRPSKEQILMCHKKKSY